MESKKNKKLKDAAEFPIIGIGASAGGLETLETFFSNMPGNVNMAFIIIQHLSPKHKSIMVSLLMKHTNMAVREIEDGMKVESNCVYLNPPGKNVTIINRTLQLMEPVVTGYINMPIDFFFRSLSEDLGERAICIILSGTATDGTLGIKAVKGKGGMAMVQDPATAKYDGMPRSAVETGVVDIVLPVEKMPGELIKYAQHPYIKPAKIKTAEAQSGNHLQKIFSLIRSVTGCDFSHYKLTTIHRRIERRMAIHQISKLDNYIIFLQKNPLEINALFKDLTIGVTNFFRDQKAFEELEKALLPVLRGIEPDESIRIWVAGCSTGEEAYSLGIVITEILEMLKKSCNVQIFATDIDEDALETARKGIYPKNIAADVNTDRLNRFFSKETGTFKIKKHIRDMIVFSIHNIIKDPPFSRLDLVSCRNLMIYMDSTLQKKILPLFHYTLKPNGILFLGTSESIGEYTDFFESIDSKWKIFKRKEGIIDRVIDTSLNKNYEPKQRPEKDMKDTSFLTTDIQSLAERVMLDEYAPSGVLINKNYEILHFIGDTEKYLSPPKGKASFNILNMARKGLRHKLTSAIHQAFQQKKKIFCNGIRIKNNGDNYIIDIIVKPLEMPQGSMLVVFEDKSPVKKPDEIETGAGKEKEPDIVSNLENELQSTKEYLHAIIEEQETSNEELKSMNEELQSVNEELQSTNEELETSKEELQSTNEELSTVNTELLDKVNELSKSEDDMNNLLAATEIASIFLDTNLRIKRFTPAMADIVKLIQTDIGRPLNDLKTSFSDIDLIPQAKEVLKTLNTAEMEIFSEDHIWYSLRIVPYRTLDNVIDGVVMTFVNIQKIKHADKIKRFAAFLQNSNDAIIILDLEGKILAWNKGSEMMYGFTETEALTMNIKDIIPYNEKKETELLLERLEDGEIIKSFKSLRKAKDGNVINVWITATALMDENGKPVEIAVTERNLDWLNEPGS